MEDGVYHDCNKTAAGQTRVIDPGRERRESRVASAVLRVRKW